MRPRAILSAARANIVRAPRRGRWALALSLLAVAWGVALVAAAFVVPAYSDGSTLAEENTAWIAIPVAVPALLAALAFLGLHRRCKHGSRHGTAGAWVAIALLLGFSVIALLSIGALTVIPALMLAVAARLTPRAARA